MTRLTDSDRGTMAQVAQFRERNGIAAIREDTCQADTIAAMAIRLGKASYLLGEQEAIIKRLDAIVTRLDEDTDG